MNAAHLLAVWRTDLLVLTRVWWVRLALLAGPALTILVGVDAASESGYAIHDAIRSGSASILLLAGLAVAVLLGSSAFAPDAARGYLGLLVGTGAGPSTVGLGRLAARATALLVIIATWAAAFQIASMAAGGGFDRPLVIHCLTMVLNLMLVLCACGAMASVIGPIAAGVFGVMVYISAQAAVNLKAALDQQAISDGSQVVVLPMYVVFPRTIVSPMISEMQARGVAGPAAPPVDVNGLDITVPASSWWTIAWTLLWTLALAGAAAYGVRRRQL
ncbi:MAG: hypothetical protein R2878_12590 [Thermoleophilia bacterium]